jgi:DNA-directed RNA polymerase specialized sigma24 family protein
MRTRLDELEIARDRQALVRRYVLDEDTGTIARDLGVSRAEVRVILCRARLRLSSACGDMR